MKGPSVRVDSLRLREELYIVSWQVPMSQPRATAMQRTIPNLGLTHVTARTVTQQRSGVGKQAGGGSDAVVEVAVVTMLRQQKGK
jgi:hypothetical protein